MRKQPIFRGVLATFLGACLVLASRQTASADVLAGLPAAHPTPIPWLRLVRPILECVADNGDGSYTAFFGYRNHNDTAVDIPVGPRNKFTPSPEDRGQPTRFHPGRTPHYPNVSFGVVFDGSEIEWHLDGQKRKAKATSHACPSPPGGAGGWSLQPPMPVGRGGAVVVATDTTTAHVITGYSNFLGDTDLNLRVEVTGSLVQYTFRTPAPTQRAELGGAWDGQSVYVAGGRGTGGPLPPYGVAILDTFERYNPSSDTWQTLDPLPTARAGLGVAAVDGKVYAIGGRTGGQGILKNGAVLDTVDIYDTGTGQWSTGPSMPTARSDFALAVSGTDVYVVGGWDGTDSTGGDLATVEVLHTAGTPTWEILPAMPTARTAPAATAIGGSVYVVGGHTAAVHGDNQLAAAEARIGGSWSSLASMIVPRAQGGAVTLASRVYAIGGRFYGEVSGGYPAGTEVEAYSE